METVFISNKIKPSYKFTDFASCLTKKDKPNVQLNESCDWKFFSFQIIKGRDINNNNKLASFKAKF